jgi:Uma2 family endonuclease
MAAAAQIASTPLTLEAYLQTSYHPDCEFVDGHLEERSLGEYEHNNLQAALIAWFFARGPEWNVRVLPEQRTRVGATRVRVPDVCLVQRDGAIEKVRVTPPILCIEILSPEDRTARTVRVLDEYLSMGVQNLWLFDPVERLAFTYSNTGLKLAGGTRLTIAETPIYLDLPELFASLD